MAKSGALKVGVIGMGAIGVVHADAYKALPEAALTAICDVNAPRLAAQGDRLGVAALFTDYRRLLHADVDAVSVCVGNVLHREVALAALKAGKHILLEKPMAMHAREAADIVVAGKQVRRVIQIGMVNRQDPSVQVALESVQKGLLGDIYHLRVVLIRRRGIPGLGGWFTTKAMSGGGPLIDIGVHWFDAAMYISGLWQPTSVSAMCYVKFGSPMKAYHYVSMWAGPPNYKGRFDVEDYATGFVRFGRKASMSFEIAWAANAEDAAFVEVLGNKGGLRVFDGKPLTILMEYNGRLADITPKFDTSANKFQLQARKFLAACRGKGQPAATAQEGLTVMKLIDGVYQSGKLCKEIPLKV